METTGLIQPLENHEKADRVIRDIVVRLRSARTKSELGNLLVHEIQRYTMFDLQIIGGRLNSEIDKLPSPYRESIRPISANSSLANTISSLPCTAPGRFLR